MFIVETVREQIRRIKCRTLSKTRINKLIKDSGGYPLKLHLGCGGYVMPGWINCDLNPKNGKVLPIDLLNELPFGDGEVKLCYMGHVLEHFSIEEVRAILKNIFKVMQNGGTLRIAQPDLKAMINDSLYSNNWESTNNDYSVTKDADISTGTHYLNLIWNAWGHKFNHSYESLKYELERAGFKKINLSKYHESDNPELCLLEQRSFKEDSLICEAKK